MNVTLALFRAWADLLRPPVFRLVLTSIALTIGLLIALQVAVVILLRSLDLGSLSLPLIGPVEIGATLGWGSLALLPVMAFMLMAPVTAAFCGLYADRVADLIEDLHYPNNRGKPVDFLDGLLHSLAIVVAMLGVALVSLILLPFLGPFAPILFYGLNGWLLGREFFQSAALRHLHGTQATAFRKRYAVSATMMGVMIALLLTVPIVNIVVPILAASAFTHLYQLSSRSSGQRLRHPRG